jgi:outer membrane immunogenic protein
MGASALAADLPSRRAAPAPYVAVPVFTWTGFYIGVNAGYGFDTGRRNDGAFAFGPGTGVTLSGPLAATAGVITPPANANRDGFVGGGQIGYNHQIGNIVVGIEADAQYADLTSRRSGMLGFVPVLGTFPVGAGFAPAMGNRSGIEWFGTVRGRLGYAWDRLLVYGTGGFAYGDGPNDCNSVGLGGAGNRCGNGSIRTGWTAGGGVEYAFTSNMTGKIEALYVNLDRSAASRYVGDFQAPVTFARTPVFVNGRRARDEEFVVVRAGLNWKFNTFGL